MNVDENGNPIQTPESETPASDPPPSTPDDAGQAPESSSASPGDGAETEDSGVAKLRREAASHRKKAREAEARAKASASRVAELEREMSALRKRAEKADRAEAELKNARALAASRSREAHAAGELQRLGAVFKSPKQRAAVIAHVTKHAGDSLAIGEDFTASGDLSASINDALEVFSFSLASEADAETTSQEQTIPTTSRAAPRSVRAQQRDAIRNQRRAVGAAMFGGALPGSGNLNPPKDLDSEFRSAFRDSVLGGGD